MMDRSDARNRIIPATCQQVFAAISTAERLARWWGPAGFSNTFHHFDFRPGGLWTLTMHGPDGQDYPNESRFLRIEPDRRVEIEHLSGHHFTLSLELEARGPGTLLRWRQVFDSPQHFQTICAFVAKANEQNLDRLSAEVARGLLAR